MIDSNEISLKEELEQFKREKEQIRAVIGQIGGVGSVKRDKTVNIAFIAVITLLLLIDSFRHILGFDIPFPPMFSLELGVLLVSIKIIWMIHRQTKVEHFQFWILSSIEFRLNELAKQMHGIEKQLEDPS